MKKVRQIVIKTLFRWFLKDIDFAIKWSDGKQDGWSDGFLSGYNKAYRQVKRDLMGGE